MLTRRRGAAEKVSDHVSRDDLVEGMHSVHSVIRASSIEEPTNAKAKARLMAWRIHQLA